MLGLRGNGQTGNKVLNKVVTDYKRMNQHGREATSKYWWVEDLIDSEVKAMGVYLALLYLLVDRRHHVLLPSIEIIKSSGTSGGSILIDKDTKSWYSLYFAGREEDARHAVEAGRIFIDRLFENEDVSMPHTRNKILSEIEVEFFGKFLKGFIRHLRLDEIPPEIRGKVREVLLNVRSRRYGGHIMTQSGTTKLNENVLKEKVYNTMLKENLITYPYKAFKEEDAVRLINCLTRSGLMLKRSFSYIFPAPCLSDEVIGLIAKSEKPADRVPIVETKSFIPPPRPARFDIKPSKEILEGIIASVFEDLGFIISTNVKREARRGSPIEVDVWAWKTVAGTRFSVYVSCKNWDKPIDRQVIDEEIGRIHNLRELPQLKVIIAKEATSPAKKAAEADGFIIIELGKKAEADNAKVIYELVYKVFNELFTSIASSKAEGERQE
jgi:hypothetical protein